MEDQTVQVPPVMPVPEANDRNHLPLLLAILGGIVLICVGGLYFINTNLSSKNNTPYSSKPTNTASPTQVPITAKVSSANDAASKLDSLQQQITNSSNTESSDFASMNTTLGNAGNDSSDSTLSSQL